MQIEREGKVFHWLVHWKILTTSGLGQAKARRLDLNPRKLCGWQGLSTSAIICCFSGCLSPANWIGSRVITETGHPIRGHRHSKPMCLYQYAKCLFLFLKFSRSSICSSLWGVCYLTKYLCLESASWRGAYDQSFLGGIPILAPFSCSGQRDGVGVVWRQGWLLKKWQFLYLLERQKERKRERHGDI